MESRWNKWLRPLNISGVYLDNNIFLAPMAGVTDMAFRLLCKREGCGLVFTEMISAKGVLYGSVSREGIWSLCSEERPVALQIFGHEPDVMFEAVQIICRDVSPDIIDINMGCPVPKVVNKDEGCALMKNIPLASAIVEAVVRAANVPVTVKIRKGWDEEYVNAVEVAQAVQKAGASAIIVHGRTRQQFYNGKADWNIIKTVKDNVSIPVIGNGDIFTPDDAKEMLSYTGCDGVMIGRAALGNPWIFRRVIHYLKTKQLLPEPTAREKIYKALEHIDLMVLLKGEYLAVRQMRKHVSWYIKGLKDSTSIRNRINHITTSSGMKKLLIEFLEYLEKEE